MSRAYRCAVGCLVVVAGCRASPDPSVSLRAPSVLKHALAKISTLEASASLVRQGGEAGAPLPLTRADDGVSFSGFVAAEPGVYTLEVVFTGSATVATGRLFLGRWLSLAPWLLPSVNCTSATVA